MTKAVDQANETAQWVSENYRRHLEAVDDFPAVNDSFLDGLNIKTKPFFRAPPSVHPRCNIHRTCPDVDQRLIFVNFAHDNIDLIEPALQWIGTDTVIVGKLDICNDVLARRELTAQPLYYFHDRIAIRID